MKRQNGTKRRAETFFYPLCCLFASAVWLTPYRYSWNYALLLAAFFGSLLLIDLIRQPVASWLAALAVSAGMCFYDVRYAVCFAPFVFVYLVFRNICRDKKGKSAKYDGLFFLQMLSLAAFAAAAFFMGFSRWVKQPDNPRQFHRQYVFLLVFAFLFLFYIFYRGAGKKRPAEHGEQRKKRNYLYVAAILCLPAVFAFVSADDVYLQLSALPVFLVSVTPLLCAETRLETI